ncbi:hypothetical protein Calkr_2559 [Caldicellulosiruptor acetigenus I77R1B]|uniref:Uncharacterized protein n=1 Tax=Caldicellulosiruptor acetigenus (strain ATCC 700853 / DSM 12137 / I77R1B) TaxID=632335 RepID=E4S8X9_CALA7|nr:hypothetical protein [Caldicellulosiruptor acetigenus]ADQ41984.1 hypothetical protein Calkr_2559 [Caldicellulosiruptor acetigenus I77R1B]
MSDGYMLEHAINEIAFELVNEKILDENEINKLLGVLSNDGVYAMWVYALDKLDKINWDFHADKNKLKDVRIFKLLEKISKLDKFITRTLEYDNLLEQISCLSKKIKEIDEKIGALKKEKENKKEEEIKQWQIEKEKVEKERRKKLNKYFLDLADNLENLLYFKELFEKTLIYARYHARAMED